MPEQNLTPEENLLRIIESPQGQTPRRGMGARPRRGSDVKAYLSEIQKGLLEQAKKFFSLRMASLALISAGGLATLFLVVDFWLGLPKSDFIDKLEQEARATDLGDLSVGQIDPLGVYVQDIKDRNMFALTAPAPKGPPANATPEETKDQAIQSALQDLITNYKVVGIIWSDMPQAIIEDVPGGRTFMVNRGSMVKVARVKDILKDRVILSYDDKDIELR